ncbi:MAG: ABC transporter substrate-binding protein [Clostridiales Family XIII bacterium]|nr:ABC transporter substrate-binding protein [Clostridiales Family XIII bacterium]
MKLKKRFFVALLSMAMVFALSACGGGGSGSDGGEGASTGDAGTEAEAPQGDAPEFIKIGIPNPSTGNIAGFGVGTPYVEDLVVQAVNAQGGIYIEEYDKKIPIKIYVVDTESDPTKASEVTQQLIENEGVNMLLARHTPNTAVPVSIMAEKFGIPCVSNGCPTAPWKDAGPYEWVFHSFWDIDDALENFVGMWKELGYGPGAVVGFLFPNDSDGLAWAAKATALCEREGFVISDPGQYPIGNQDWTPIINKFKADKVQIIVGDDVAPDFTSFSSQASQQSLKYDLVTMGRAFLFPADANSNPPEIAAGLTNEVWWSPAFPFKSSLDGMTCAEFVEKYEENQKTPWASNLGDKYSGMEIAVDALTRAASLDPEKIRAALAETDLDTLSAHIKYDPETHVSVTPIVAGQWKLNEAGDGVYLTVVYNGRYPEIPTDAKLELPADMLKR